MQRTTAKTSRRHFLSDLPWTPGRSVGSMAATSGIFASLMVSMGCAPTSGQSSDPNAFYGSLAGQHTFIVSHVFNANVYENRLGFSLPQAPELNTPDVLLQCFYELRLSNSEMSQCAQSTGLERYTPSEQLTLNESDVWRLMVLQSDKTSALSEYVVPQKIFENEVRNNWKSNAELVTLAGQTGQIESIPAASNTGTSTQGRVERLPLLPLTSGQTHMGGNGPQNLALVDLKGLLNPGKWVQDNWETIRKQGLNSATCLLTRDPPTLANAVIQALGLIPGVQPVVSVLGGLINFIRPPQTQQSSLATLAQDCGQGLVRAVNLQQPASTPPTAQRIQEIEQAAASSNPAELRQLLQDETSRQIESINAEDFRMRSTLREAANKVPGQSLAEMRNNIRTLSIRIGNSLNGARCLPAKRFAMDVLKPVLLAEANGTDTDASIGSRMGCRGTGTVSAPVQAQQQIPQQQAQQTQQSAAQTVGSAGPDPKALQAQIAQQLAPLVAEIQTLKAALVKQQTSSGAAAESPSSGASTSQEGPATTASIMAKYASVTPAACKANGSVAAGISPTELENRLATCAEPMGTSDATHTFGKFSDALRQSCVTKSAQTSASAATCLCSCRWSTPFYQFLGR